MTMMTTIMTTRTMTATAAALRSERAPTKCVCLARALLFSPLDSEQSIDRNQRARFCRSAYVFMLRRSMLRFSQRRTGRERERASARLLLPAYLARYNEEMREYEDTRCEGAKRRRRRATMREHTILWRRCVTSIPTASVPAPH